MVNDKCSKCGAELPADAMFCSDCGTKVREEIDEQIQKKNKLTNPQDEVLNKSTTVIQDEAQNILRTRYAKGEITKKEYKKKTKVLQK
jgi:DNA-directed RNA polymerase subunit RPC12/RpoP